MGVLEQTLAGTSLVLHQSLHQDPPSTAALRGVQQPSLRHCQLARPQRGSSRLVCKSTSSIVAEGQPYASGFKQMGTIPSSPGTGTELPKELATLQELVSQLSKKAMEEDSGAQELREAVGSLAENLTRQISAVALSAKPHATSQLANIPGRSYLDYVSSPAPNGSEPDSEGQGDEELVEPMFPRSEVIAMRSLLNKKLSESNVYNRFLLREIQYREDGLRDTKAVLVALLSEMKEVFNVVDDLTTAESFIPYGSISTTSRPSALKEKMEGLTFILEKQLQGVDAMRLREVPLVWFGMAEDVKVMGSFDGWTYGEQMSPEATGTMTRFTTVLKLRPGRYEIKFLVDGEWRVAPEWPTEGHGMTENNVLVVD